MRIGAGLILSLSFQPDSVGSRRLNLLKTSWKEREREGHLMSNIVEGSGRERETDQTHTLIFMTCSFLVFHRPLQPFTVTVLCLSLSLSRPSILVALKQTYIERN